MHWPDVVGYQNSQGNNGFVISKGKATPSGNTVSGQGLSQVKRRAGGFSHYVIIPLSEHDHKNSCCRTVIYTFSNKGM